MIILMRLLGRNATSLPGKIAILFARNLPAYLTFGQNITIITGTNGKTTTTRMLCSIYTKAGYKVITNVSGANLISGIVTTLVEKLSFAEIRGSRKRGVNGDINGMKSQIRIILETDEGSFGRHSAALSPAIIAVTNLFRDQLDRFGELSKTRELIRKGIDAVPGAKVVLCADDSLSASIYPQGRKFLMYTGVSIDNMHIDTKHGSASTEAGNCVFCGANYLYSFRSYGHLGHYACPGCGFKRPEPDLICSYSYTGNNFYTLEISFVANTGMSKLPDKLLINLPIPGEHNIYNTMTAVGAALSGNISAGFIKSGVEDSKAGFGRMEKFEIGGREICIILVKNPIGLERALDFLQNATDLGGVSLLLNDNIADGTDVSWIWDVDFESFRLETSYYVSGTRCYDMALRLKYSGVPESNIIVDTEYITSFESAIKNCKQNKCLYILPNYTSLLSLRAYFEKKYHLKGIWE